MRLITLPPLQLDAIDAYLAAPHRAALLQQQQQQQQHRRQVIAKAFATADRMWRETIDEAADQPAMQRSVYSSSRLSITPHEKTRLEGADP